MLAKDASKIKHFFREVLERAGVMKRTKNSYKTLFQTAKKSGLFRKSARGEFELIEGQ